MEQQNRFSPCNSDSNCLFVRTNDGYPSISEERWFHWQLDALLCCCIISWITITVLQYWQHGKHHFVSSVCSHACFHTHVCFNTIIHLRPDSTLSQSNGWFKCNFLKLDCSGPQRQWVYSTRKHLKTKSVPCFKTKSLAKTIIFLYTKGRISPNQ